MVYIFVPPIVFGVADPPSGDHSSADNGSVTVIVYADRERRRVVSTHYLDLYTNKPGLRFRRLLPFLHSNLSIPARDT